MTDTHADSGLRGFLNRGGFWRFVPVLLVYIIIYLGAGWVGSKLAGHFVTDDLLSSVGSVFFQLTLALIVGSVVLVAFSSYMGWTHDLFARQPIYKSWWMWLGPIVALIPVVLRVFGISWGQHAFPIVALVLVTGLMIGFVEELLCRGIAVKMLRDGGHGEWAVAALSSLVFALIHSFNLLSGQSITTVGPTVVYTFAFGVLMYLTLRSVGFLIGAMIVHGLTDPTTILASGGIDEITTSGSSSPIMNAAGGATLLLIVVGFVLLIFIRGKVAGTRATPNTDGVHA
jgi:membrane protease YdiL (CAAX protease family)